MEKKTYYISVASRGISEIKTASPFELVIEATEDEVWNLRQVFNDIHSAEWAGFFRAHVPYVQYHFDKENDMIDRDLIKVYKMLHSLGKPETKEHIESMGILESLDDHSTM